MLTAGSDRRCLTKRHTSAGGASTTPQAVLPEPGGCSFLLSIRRLEQTFQKAST
jgi:hypothetical protein